MTHGMLIGLVYNDESKDSQVEIHIGDSKLWTDVKSARHYATQILLCCLKAEEFNSEKEDD